MRRPPRRVRLQLAPEHPPIVRVFVPAGVPCDRITASRGGSAAAADVRRLVAAACECRADRDAQDDGCRVKRFANELTSSFQGDLGGGEKRGGRDRRATESFSDGARDAGVLGNLRSAVNGSIFRHVPETWHVPRMHAERFARAGNATSWPSPASCRAVRRAEAGILAASGGRISCAVHRASVRFTRWRASDRVWLDPGNLYRCGTRNAPRAAVSPPTLVSYNLAGPSIPCPPSNATFSSARTPARQAIRGVAAIRTAPLHCESASRPK